MRLDSSPDGDGLGAAASDPTVFASNEVRVNMSSLSTSVQCLCQWLGPSWSSNRNNPNIIDYYLLCTERLSRVSISEVRMLV